MQTARPIDVARERQLLSEVARSALSFLVRQSAGQTLVQLREGVDWPGGVDGDRVGLLRRLRQLDVLREAPDGTWGPGGTGLRWRGLTAKEAAAVGRGLDALCRRLRSEGAFESAISELSVDERVLDVIQSVNRLALQPDWRAGVVAVNLELLDVDVAEILRRPTVQGLESVTAPSEVDSESSDRRGPFDPADLRGKSLAAQVELVVGFLGVAVLAKPNNELLAALAEASAGYLKPSDSDINDYCHVGNSLNERPKTSMKSVTEAISRLRKKYNVSQGRWRRTSRQPSKGVAAGAARKAQGIADDLAPRARKRQEDGKR